jgi:hypothetical protein
MDGIEPTWPQRLEQERGGEISGDIPRDQRLFHNRRGRYSSESLI